MNYNDTAYRLLNKLLIKNNYFIPLSGIKKMLNSHPEFPSLKSITDTLDSFNVENLAATIPVSSIDKLPKTFIAVLKNGELCLVNNRVNNLEIVTQSLTKVRKTISEFQKDWTGGILAVEKSNPKVSKGLIIKWLGLGFLLFILFSNSNLETVITPLFSLIGLIVSVLIVRKGLGLSDNISQKICSNKGEGNCDSVINYKVDGILGKISFGDLSLVFFIAITIISFFIGFDYLFYLVLFLLCIPVILYSIFLQGIKIRQWCALCLMISSVILLLNTELVFNEFNLAFNSLFWKRSFSVFTIISVVWIYVKPYVLKYIGLIDIELDYLKFKRNFKLFNALLTQNRKVETNSIKKMRLGSNSPKIIVDVVISPTCSYCKNTFNVFRKILKKNTHKEKIQVNFIFNINLESKNDVGRHISAQILNLNKEFGVSESYNAMKFWFDTKNYKKWNKKYNTVDSKIPEILVENTKWCELNNINHTPQVILNGYLYPSEFDIEGIEFQMEGLLK